MTRSEQIALAAKMVEQGIVPAAPAKPPIQCIHFGEATGESATCLPCGGRVQLKVFSCAELGTCTISKPVQGVPGCCNGCPRKVLPASPQFAPVTTRNLIYYVYPVQGNGVWQTCVRELRERLDLFNGKIVVFVSEDSSAGRRPYGIIDGPREGYTTDSVQTVVTEFGSDAKRIIFLAGKNNPDRWESFHHQTMFAATHDLSPNSATLYAHAKGVTRPDWHMAHEWRQVLVETLLDHWQAVEFGLSRHPVSGSFKKAGPGWPSRESRSRWHYSGSWFWFRNRELYSRNWRKIDQFWAAIESYPSLHFKQSEAHCVFHESRTRAMNLYSFDYWKHVVRPELERWRQQHAVKASL